MGGKTTERNRITDTAMYVRQTIEIRPNNKQKTYFRQCFGAHRLAYNYGLAEWIRRRDRGEKTNVREIRAQFNRPAARANGRGTTECCQSRFSHRSPVGSKLVKNLRLLGETSGKAEFTTFFCSST